jgi:hypothetical protein
MAMKYFCEICDYHSFDVEDSGLVGYDVIDSRRFEVEYRLHLLGLRSPRRKMKSNKPILVIIS